LGRNGKEGIMKKKQATIAGLALVVVAGAILAFWLFSRTKPPEPMRMESSPQASSERQRPDVQIQPFPKDTAQEQEKRVAVPQGKLKSWARGPDGEAYPFASATWIMEQQRIAPGGLTKEHSISWVWIKGDRKRVETFRTLGSWAGTAGQPAIVVFVDEGYVYEYLPDQRKMWKVPRAVSLEVLSKKWTKKRSEERIGRDVVDGKTCETYLLVNDVSVAGMGTVTMEVRESRWQGLVLRSVSQTLGSTIRDILVTELKDVRLDVPIPDEKFILPTGVSVQEVKAPPEEAIQASIR
jgi:hypothetical protein